MLRTLGFSAVPLHGQLSQSQRLGALGKFKSGSRSILVATDIASRCANIFLLPSAKSQTNPLLIVFSGLDIPSVDVVINFDVPTHSKDYIHRVGRTARAGRAGKSITIVTQYDVEFMQRLERVLGKSLELWPTNKEEMLLLRERVDEAARLAANELKEGTKEEKQKQKYHGTSRRTGDDQDRDDDVVEAGMPVRTNRKRKLRR
jgi:ATP-dependent RNA helicase DDX47/RRP3